MPRQGRKTKIVYELDGLVSNAGDVNGSDKLERREMPSPDEPPSTKRPRMESTSSSNDIMSLEQLVCELTLPIFLTFYQACAFVPHSWVHHREGAIENIIRAAYPDIGLSQTKLSSAINTIDLHLADHASVQVGNPSPKVLWKATHDTGIAHLRFLASPTVWCLRCQSPLCSNNPPTNVVLYSQDGPIPASKLDFRCTRCSLNYHPEWFGNYAEGYSYYNVMQPVVKCTQKAYMERQLSSTIAAVGYDINIIMMNALIEYQ